VKRDIVYLTIVSLALALITACSSGVQSKSNEFGIKVALRGLWKEAAFRWEKALEEEPNNPYIHNNLAVAYENFGEYDKAFKEYKIALQLEPGNYHIKSNFESFELFYQKLKTEEKEEESSKEEDKKE
jgi:Tfp pilus assembly protein PilF